MDKKIKLADIQSITQGSSYTGNSVLGGNVGIGVTIDPSPMQRLATFTYYRDQHLWEQKQKDDAVAAKQIAAMTAYDITSPLTQYSDKLKTKLDELQNYVRENPDSLVYGRNPQKFLEREKKINEFETLRDAATSSSVIYSARKTEIDKNPIPEDRQVFYEELDVDVEELFESGVDVNKVLKSSAPIRPDDYKIPDVAITTVEEIAVLGDGVIGTTIERIDGYKLDADAELAAAKGRGPAIDENSTWFKSLSPKRQAIERKKAAITSRERQKVINLSSTVNKLLSEYMAAHPNATLESIVGDPSGDSTLVDIIKSVNAINGQVKAYNQLVLAGKVSDPTGKVLRQTMNEINLADGLSEAEVIKMNALQKSGNAIIKSVKKEFQSTDNLLQARGLSIQEYNARTNRMQEDRMALEGGGGSTNSLLKGNALNDIEIDENAEVGEYVMRPDGNLQNIANIQRLLGTIKDKSGKDIPILSKKQLETDEISYQIENIEGRPFVTKLKVNNVWYDRGYFRNAQLNLDKEPKGGQKTSYKQAQQYKGGRQAKPQQSTTTKKDWNKYKVK